MHVWLLRCIFSPSCSLGGDYLLRWSTPCPLAPPDSSLLAPWKKQVPVATGRRLDSQVACHPHAHAVGSARRSYDSLHGRGSARALCGGRRAALARLGSALLARHGSARRFTRCAAAYVRLGAARGARHGTPWRSRVPVRRGLRSAHIMLAGASASAPWTIGPRARAGGASPRPGST